MKKLLHELFESKVNDFPNNIAISSIGKQFTYSELSALTNRIARKLLELNAKPNTLIAIIMEKGW